MVFTGKWGHEIDVEIKISINYIKEMFFLKRISIYYF